MKLKTYSSLLVYGIASLTFSNSLFCPHSVFTCFLWIWEQTAIISLYNINWLVCTTEMESVYCAVRTGSLYIIQVMCFVWIWEQTATISLYNINWLVCTTEMESVYCAVRTGSLCIIQVMCFVWIWEQTAIISLQKMCKYFLTNAPRIPPFVQTFPTPTHKASHYGLTKIHKPNMWHVRGSRYNSKTSLDICSNIV
jgi:hypothetical protein